MGQEIPNLHDPYMCTVLLYCMITEFLCKRLLELVTLETQSMNYKSKISLDIQL